MGKNYIKSLKSVTYIASYPFTCTLARIEKGGIKSSLWNYKYDGSIKNSTVFE